VPECLCIVGVGLIGGSFALAARRAGLFARIVGVDADHGNLARALEMGVIDAAHADPAEGAADADVVLLAVPVGAYESLFRALQAAWSERTIYTDAGSTKGSVLDAARRVFGSVPGNFVPGHPIAGAEKSGVTAAGAELFHRKRVILTPASETDPEALSRVAELWRALGAEVAEMSAERHDRLLAGTSHLPHVAAFALTHLLGREDEQEDIFRYAAGGFRDFTRIASSDPVVWRDICLANREAILERIEDLRGELAHIAGLIERGDGAALQEVFAGANAARQRFLELFENHHHA
jgi:prephenate dehydrogenase